MEYGLEVVQSLVMVGFLDGLRHLDFGLVFFVFADSLVLGEFSFAEGDFGSFRDWLGFVLLEIFRFQFRIGPDFFVVFLESDLFGTFSRVP